MALIVRSSPKMPKREGATVRPACWSDSLRFPGLGHGDGVRELALGAWAAEFTRMAEPAYRPWRRSPCLSISSTPSRRWSARLFRCTYRLQSCSVCQVVRPDSFIVSRSLPTETCRMSRHARDIRRVRDRRERGTVQLGGGSLRGDLPSTPRVAPPRRNRSARRGGGEMNERWSPWHLAIPVAIALAIALLLVPATLASTPNGCTRWVRSPWISSPVMRSTKSFWLTCRAIARWASP